MLENMSNELPTPAPHAPLCECSDPGCPELCEADAPPPCGGQCTDADAPCPHCLDWRFGLTREAALLARFNAQADWDGEEPCAEVHDLRRLIVRVPIGGGWNYFTEAAKGRFVCCGGDQ